MYEEATYAFDYSNAIKKVCVIIAILFIIFICIYLFMPKQNTNNDYFQDNLNTMVGVAQNYYLQNDEENKITLKEMIDKKMILAFIDENGNSCDINNSYAQKTNNKIEVYLSCNNKRKVEEIEI